MFRFIVILLFVAISTACFPKQAFRPPPPAFKSWGKIGASDSDVKAQMLDCGYRNPYSADRRDSINDEAKHQLCMFSNGYKFKSGYKGLCYSPNWETKPACVEHAKKASF